MAAFSGVGPRTISVMATEQQAIHTAHETLPVARIRITFLARSPSISILSASSRSACPSFFSVLTCRMVFNRLTFRFSGGPRSGPSAATGC